MESLRKAAILVTSLDRDLADVLLDRLPDSQADEIRHAVLGLETVSRLEEEQTILDFLSSNKANHNNEPSSELEVTEPFATSSLLVANEPAPESTLQQRLEEASASLLARLLQNELPQTIALALSEMEVNKASEVVSLLDVDSQSEILQRLVELDKSPQQESEYIRREFRVWLEELLNSAIQRSQLVSRLSSVVESASQPTRERILENLARTDSTLAEDLHRSHVHALKVPSAPAVASSDREPQAITVSDEPAMSDNA